MTIVVNQPDLGRSAKRARPYTLTAGRTRPGIDLPLETTVQAVPNDGVAHASDDPHSVILRLCAVRQSIAELASYANLPIGVARVLVGDLVESGHLRVHATITEQSTPEEQRGLIERTLDGLRTL